MRVRIVITLMLICSFAKANDHYISFASDLNNLISGNTLQPGNKVIMRNGIWNSQTITFKETGTETNPITLMAETVGRIIMPGNSRLVVGNARLITDDLSFMNSYSSTHTIKTLITN